MTLACERGECCRIGLEVSRNEQGRLAGRITVPEGQRPFAYGSFAWRFMSDGVAGEAR